MKLYALEKGSKIYGFKNQDGEVSVIIFDHVDGMYSYCYFQNDKDAIVHLNATTELFPFKDGYSIFDGWE